jgi:hypothetical protein
MLQGTERNFTNGPGTVVTPFMDVNLLLESKEKIVRLKSETHTWMPDAVLDPCSMATSARLQIAATAQPVAEGNCPSSRLGIMKEGQMVHE